MDIEKFLNEVVIEHYTKNAIAECLQTAYAQAVSELKDNSSFTKLMDKTLENFESILSSTVAKAIYTKSEELPLPINAKSIDELMLMLGEAVHEFA